VQIADPVRRRVSRTVVHDDDFQVSILRLERVSTTTRMVRSSL